MTIPIAGWRRLLRIWRAVPQRDVDAELHFHFGERTADLIARGASADTARAQAMAEFGDVASVRAGLVAIDARVARHRGRAERWEWVVQDLAYVLRTLRRSPAFFIAVALTLSLGIGVNAAIFSVLDRLYLEVPPGIVHPEALRRLIIVYPAASSSAGRPRSVLTYDELRDLPAALPGTSVGGYDTDVGRLGRGTDASQITVVHVIGDYFNVLGVAPAAGRFFAPEELGVSDPAPVVVISSRLWRTRFNSSGDAIGQTLSIGGRRFTIIGVVRGDFHGADNDAGDVWLPINAERLERGGGADWYRGTASIQTLVRIASVGQLASVVQGATRVIRNVQGFPGDSAANAALGPLVQASAPGSVNPGVTIATRLAVVSLIILLIACANVTNLLLARGVRRRREIAVRLALGVSRRRLVGLLLMESGLAALAGGVLAVGVAFEAAAILRNMLVPYVHWTDATINVHVLLFTVGTAIVVGIGAGLVPALHASRTDLTRDLRGSLREGVYQRSRLRSALVAAQAALSVVLLVGAGLVIRSLLDVETIPTGYDTDRVLFASIKADPDHDNRRAEIATRLPGVAAELRRLPGVEQAGIAANIPMYTLSWLDIALPGHDSLPKVAADGPFVLSVAPDYFATVGIRLVQGELFRATDRRGATAPVVVNETMAHAYWPGADAIGQCVILDGRHNGCSRVIGVVSDVHAMRIVEHKPAMQFYVPLADSGFGMAGVIAVRSAPGKQALVAAEVSRQLTADFSGWAEPNVRLMKENLARELRPWQTGATLFSAAGLLALLVAMIGVYSTISYTFSQRTHEIGVRIALGARATNVLRLVVGEGLRVVLIGVVIGVALSLAAGRLIASMLYRTSPHDPVVLGTVVVVLLVVAALACLIPAARALKVDPAIALRSD